MKQIDQEKTYTLAEIVQILGPEADVTIQGDPNCIIKGVCTVQNTHIDHITFLVNPLYKKYLPQTQAAAVILSADLAKECAINALIARNPYYIYARIATLFDSRSRPKAGIHASAVIGEGCEIDPSASIGANCVIADGVKIAEQVIIGAGSVVGEYAIIGKNSRLDANVTLYDRVKLGENVQIASGTVIGSDGFGNAKHQDAWHKVPQLGAVVIEDGVDIGANCAIDRGAIEDTLIAKGAKLDNLIQVGHNVQIGENTAIAGCVAIAGSAVIGKNCMIGGTAAINGHVTLTDNVVIMGGGCVTNSVREPGVYASSVFNLETSLEWRKSVARFNRLDHLMQRIKVLETAIQELTERKAT